MANPTGKFIVIYGPPNLGKTTQAKRTVDELIKRGIPAEYIKYPIYDLEPTGPRLNGILRHKTEVVTPLEMQRIYVRNRWDYAPILQQKLAEGCWIVSEDYRGTGIAWGVTQDVPLHTMEEMNIGLREPDLSICFDGARFTSGIEREHILENSGLWNKNREVHRMLAERYDWHMVNANQLEQNVTSDILKIVSTELMS